MLFLSVEGLEGQGSGSRRQAYSNAGLGSKWMVFGWYEEGGSWGRGRNFCGAWL
jgi:hypothetical protein